MGAPSLDSETWESKNLNTRNYAVIALRQLPPPDIPETERLALIAVSLQLDGRRVILLVEGLANIECLPFQLKVIVDEDTIEEDRSVGRCFDRAVVVEGGCSPGGVVDVPLARFAHGVGERDALLVETAGHAVHIRLVVIRVQHLQLVARVSRSCRSKKNTAVATRLAAARNVFGNPPFDMELVVLEGTLGFDVADARFLAHRDDAVVHDPLRRRVVLR